MNAEAQPNAAQPTPAQNAKSVALEPLPADPKLVPDVKSAAVPNVESTVVPASVSNEKKIDAGK